MIGLSFFYAVFLGLKRIWHDFLAEQKGLVMKNHLCYNTAQC